MNDTQSNPLYSQLINNNSASVYLRSATLLDKASHFLWNDKLLVQANCQGYVNAQFMQPEPSKYSKGPNIEGTTFMQPEMPYYAEHPGRFVFVKDEDSGEIFSVPYAPMKVKLDSFEFASHSHQVAWKVEHLGLVIEWAMTLPVSDSLEAWQLKIYNTEQRNRRISVYPCFSIGFMSWMNQAANFDQTLNAIVANCVTPYQKVEDYFAHQHFKDITFFHANRAPDSWCANWQTFIGDTGIHAPSSLNQDELANSESCYEMPVAVMQFKVALEANGEDGLEFLFGPAQSTNEVAELIDAYSGQYKSTLANYKRHQDMGLGQFDFVTGDTEFDNFVNHWLPRQAIYHGELNRLTTDPQTRNFLQDTMALLYFAPEKARDRLLLAISQQKQSGQMPDGILLNDTASLKYINQVPHLEVGDAGRLEVLPDDVAGPAVAPVQAQSVVGGHVLEEVVEARLENGMVAAVELPVGVVPPNPHLGGGARLVAGGHQPVEPGGLPVDGVDLGHGPQTPVHQLAALIGLGVEEESRAGVDGVFPGDVAAHVPHHKERPAQHGLIGFITHLRGDGGIAMVGHCRHDPVLDVHLHIQLPRRLLGVHRRLGQLPPQHIALDRGPFPRSTSASNNSVSAE